MVGDGGHRGIIGLEGDEIADIMNGIARCIHGVDLHFRYRPIGPDPTDELVIETAIKGRYALSIPDSTKAAAECLARTEGIFLNPFIATAVAEKVATLETADAFFQERARQPTGRGRDLLAHAGTEPPRTGDETPDGDR